ncbi:aminoacyl-tRNA hydrolase [Pseudalkalibacillus caeni]|uniref:Peptidyl-tRNA hydrolase n=1 Tax=Exobacillus caeni TaxID=2574798 RepID=A0A5R9F2H6_9BACL|nr:aminoacyl-tRNA hydrolase [Pseudalkalibacillus caeni]TLS35113.1 aminoacyl-tRNA hydrolase [Pseudalkalibacillus caeni]
MKLIVGLGNPGRKYEDTRHNIGFKVIDQLSEKLGIELDNKKFNGIYGKKNIEGESIFLLKPYTYMNLSGESVRPIMDYFDIPLEDLLVVYDDLDLPVGKIRLRQKGSAGGHNGIKSLIAHLNSQDFKRIRIGVDRPPSGMSVPDYVLSRFRKEEEDQIKNAVNKSAAASEKWINTPFLEVMNEFNQ